MFQHTAPFHFLRSGAVALAGASLLLVVASVVAADDTLEPTGVADGAVAAGRSFPAETREHVEVTAVDLKHMVSWAEGRVSGGGDGIWAALRSGPGTLGEAGVDPGSGERYHALMGRSVGFALQIPEPMVGADKLYLRIRPAHALRRLTVRLDGAWLPPQDLAPGWQTLVFPLSGPGLVVGEHLVRLDFAPVPRARPLEDKLAPERAVALLATIGASREAPATSDIGEPLALADGECLRWYFVWPDLGRLELPRADSTGDPDPPAAVLETEHGGSAGKDDAVRLTLCGPGRFADAKVVAPVDRPPSAVLPDRERLANGVVVVMLDSTRADVMEAMDLPPGPAGVARTPFVRMLADTGVRFRNLVAASSYSRPTTASFFTSTYPRVHGYNEKDDEPPRGLVDLSRTLRDAGVKTMAVDGSGYALAKLGHKWDRYKLKGGWAPADVLVDEAIAFLDGVTPGEPFFLFVLLVDSHLPYTAPPDVIASYFPEPYRGFVSPEATSGIATRVKGGSLKLAGRHFEYFRALYRASVTHADLQIGRLLEEMASRGLSDETAVVVTADHGDEFLEHGAMGHGHALWEGQIHIPLVMHLPSPGMGGRVVDAPVEQVDLAPTVLDILGVRAPEGFQGSSLLGHLTRPATVLPPPAFAEMPWHGAAVHFGRFKLYRRYRSRFAPLELFDLVADPGEATDVMKAHPFAAHMGERILLAWKAAQLHWHKGSMGRFATFVPEPEVGRPERVARAGSDAPAP